MRKERDKKELRKTERGKMKQEQKQKKKRSKR